MNSVFPSYAQGFARCAAESANPGLWPGLQGLWLPALGSTGDTLRDWAGRGIHGTLTNMALAADWSMTAKGWALDFKDTASQHVDCGTAPNIAFPGDFSIAAWVKFDTWLNYDNVIVSRGKDGVGDFFFYQYIAANGEMGFFVNDGAGKAFRWQLGSQPTDWHLHTVVRAGDQMHAYLDGLEITPVLDDVSGQAVNINSTVPLRFGCRASTPERFLNGQLAFVGMWNRALVLNEIQQLTGDHMALARPRRRVYSVAGVSPATYYYQYLMRAAL